MMVERMMNTPGWYDRCFAGTRGSIVALLRREGRTVRELAEALGMTDNAVRAHLSTLENDGLVRPSGRRAGLRKPHVTYGLTPEAEYLFPKAHAPVLEQILDVLQERTAAEERDTILREVGHRLAAPHLSTLKDKPLSDRIEATTLLLGKLGGLAEVEDQNGERFIRGFSCPLSGIVVGHPEVCRVAETLIADLVGVPVREQCERSESPRCCFQVLPEG